MRRRRLSDDEHALWRGVTRSVAPLRKRSPAPPSIKDEAAAPVPAKPQATVRSPEPLAAPARPAPPPLAPLVRRARNRIAKGARSIDARLDLHGMTQAEAHDALLGFLRAKQARGARLVLIITGKGLGEFGGRGVLKRMVPLWLEQPDFRSLVAGLERAGLPHGGEGALYVTLRRPR